MRIGLHFGTALACLAASTSALAEDASKGADDAFGKLVGLESIGLYGEGQVRGFNLQNAGNYRIEGNYFTRASPPFYLIRSGTTVRIGVNALRYDFPAPSGVIEYDLVQPAPGSSLSVEAGTRAYSGIFADVVGNWGRQDGKLGIVATANLAPKQHYINGAEGDLYGAGAVARWRPTQAVNLTSFVSVVDWEANPDTGYVPSGNFLPPKLKRGAFRGQSWAKFDQKRLNAGLFGTADLGAGWRVQSGMFHSSWRTGRDDFNLVEFRNAAGDYDVRAFVVPPKDSSSRSGSILVERGWGSEALRHRIVATARLRRTVSRNTPSLSIDIGSASLGGPFPRIPEPSLAINNRQVSDVTRQLTVGVGYRLGIGGKLELRADVQKTDYQKSRTGIDGTRTEGKSTPWLYSTSALWGVTNDLTLFGSYSRGLEESGVAPNSATNRGEVLPAVLATQRELGARYSLTPALSLIAGLFDTRKQTPGTAPDGRFDLVGEVRHRGVEASLAGAVTPRLNVVAGLMVLDAKLSGPLVDQKVIGRHAVAQPSHVALLNLDWRPKLVDGLSLDATLTRRGKAYISSANVTQSKLQTTVDLGARYRLKLGGMPVMVRGRVLNLFNTFYWQPTADGTLYPSPQRGFDVTLSTEL